MYNDKVKNITLASLVADAYSLGAHWVYDENQLAKLPINWDELNDPQAMWHKNKKSGDFTHYGDKLVWLWEYAKTRTSFDIKEYISYYLDKLSTYEGYEDGATRESKVLLQEQITGSSSDDFSVVGLIAPLLSLSSSEDEFLNNVSSFVKTTHNSSQSVECAEFFAKLLLEVLKGNDLEQSIKTLSQASSYTKEVVNNIEQKLNDSTFSAIRQYGPACGSNEAFSGSLYLLLKYKSLKQLLIENAKSGGDSSARAMAASMIFAASQYANDIPKSWYNLNKNIC